MFTRIWFVAALTRALRTLAQTAVALIGTTAVIEGVDWLVVVSAAALAAVLSLLTSLAGLPEAPSSLALLEIHADVQAAGNDPTGFPYAWCTATTPRIPSGGVRHAARASRPVRNPRTAAPSDPVPAHEGPDVTTLLIELARLHGISEAAERSNHGLPPTPPPLED